MDIVWTTPARRDISAILEYLGSRNPNTARMLDKHILQAIEKLADFPYLGRPGRQEGTRELVITRYPYIVVYGVMANEIVIYRILHTAQNRPPDDEDGNQR